MKCAWCGRDGAGIHVLMSKDHPSCPTCYLVWYDQDPKTPQDLRGLSLEQAQNPVVVAPDGDAEGGEV